MGGNDGGIYFGTVLSVITSYPCVCGAASHDQEQRSAIVGAGNPLDSFQRIRIGDGPDMDTYPGDRSKYKWRYFLPKQ